MAGIGFELKKLFRRKGILAKLRAVSYTGAVTTGPMLLGVILLAGISIACEYAGMPRMKRELLNCMATYTLLFSLMVNGILSLPVTRYIADRIFEGRDSYVLPAFMGTNFLLLTIGGVLYALFLLLSGTELLSSLLMMLFLGELIVNWNAMSFLSALKDYKAIFMAFLYSIGLSLTLAVLLVALHWVTVNSMLFAVTCGYGVMMLLNVRTLYRYFPQREGSCFLFLHWIDEYRSLIFIGILTNVGMFSHLVIMWFSSVGVQTTAFFRCAPFYDVAAICAFITILASTINYVVSVEVNFYPRYRSYYSLFNSGGTITDIVNAEKAMLSVLEIELLYNALKQLAITALALSVGAVLLEYLPLGFNDLMLGYFRTLCVGYGIYAVANTLLLTQLYFADYPGALFCAAVFAVTTTAGTLISLFFSEVYYGFGFLIGCACFMAVCIARLFLFTRKLNYHVLCTQPLISEDRSGLFTDAQRVLERLVR